MSRTFLQTARVHRDRLRRRRAHLAVAVLLPGFLASWACTDSASSDAGGFGGAGFDGGVNVGTGGGDSAGELPPEEELEENFRAPVVSGPFLWSANPDTNRVALIDARNLDIEVIDGGHSPTYLAALPSGATAGGALVINALGNDASLFELRSDELGMGGAQAVSETRVPVQEGASGWSVGATGQFAIAWSRFAEGLLGPTDGYQDLTVLEVGGDQVTTTRLAVGFRPSQVHIDSSETHAYVVADPGISVIDLASDPPAVVRELFLPEEVTGTARDVSFTPDGSLAFVRLGGESSVLVIETETDDRVTVDLPAEVTDLDLSGDGSLAVAVMRGETGGSTGPGGMGGIGGAGGEAAPSRIALLPVPGIFGSPASYDLLTTDELVGSAVVSDNAESVVLFTNAAPEPHVSVLDVASQKLRVVDLKAPARAAFVSSDGSNSVFLMDPPSASNRGGAFALVPLEQNLPARIEGTATAPRFVSVTSESALVTTRGSGAEGSAEAFLGRYPTLSVDRIEIPSEPLASGLVPDANQGFVSQEHPEGRVTFIDLESAVPRTVTGFELSSKVVE